jgi:hypothetical protein
MGTIPGAPVPAARGGPVALARDLELHREGAPNGNKDPHNLMQCLAFQDTFSKKTSSIDGLL